jgi:hypothetical protein
MRNSADLSSSQAPILGILGAAATVLGLIIAAERSGLPLNWSEFFVRITLFITFLTAVWFGRSAAERFFFGYAPAALAEGSGLVLGAILFSTSSLFQGSEQEEIWLAKILGGASGILLAHSLLRIQHRRNKMEKRETGEPAPSLAGTPVLRFSLGGALCVLGFVIAMSSSLHALSEISPALNASKNLALGYILLLAVLSVALGGARGAITMAGMLAFLATGGIIIALTIGLHASGTLPLPWFDSATTLQAVNDLKNGLGLPRTVILQKWPSLLSIFNPDSLTAFTLSTLVSSAIALALAPSIEVNRRQIASTACITVVLLPLLVMAISAYAIEAAAEQFLGTSINNPPSGLLEASRLGLLKICGAFPETVEALRTQCAVAPRDTAQIDTARLQLQPNFLVGGLPVALGFTSVIVQAVSVFPFAMSLVGLLIGIWFMALGLGRYILGQKHDRPGLASHRIALTRLSAVVAALSIAMMLQFQLTLSPAVNAVLGALSAAAVVLIHFSAALSSRRAPLQTPHAA